MTEQLKESFDFTPELETFVANYPGPTHVCAYELFPELVEMERWREDDASWPSHWWPLSSKYHLIHFFWDLKDGSVGMLGAFPETDEASGLYNNATRVYDSLEDFQRIVASNQTHLSARDAFMHTVDTTGHIPEELEELTDRAAEAINREVPDVNGPKILPFFHGTLGQHDSLASPEAYQTLSW